MKNIYKKIISTLVISAALSTSAVAIEKLHFVIPGGAGGGGGRRSHAANPGAPLDHGPAGGQAGHDRSQR